MIATDEPNLKPLNPDEMRILQLLWASSEPVRSRDLRTQAGLFENEFRNCGVRLLKREYVRRTVKRLRQRVGIGVATKPVAFWSLTDKGRHAYAVWLQTDPR